MAKHAAARLVEQEVGASRSSAAMKRDCAHSVSPGGGATPPTMTSPTSPSAWQETTWMSFALRMALSRVDGVSALS